MKVLLHACCGPCALTPCRELVGEGIELQAVFVNPNIHPFTEWDRRREALEQMAAAEGVRLLPPAVYDPVAWWREVAFREVERCRLCHHLRLQQVARLARRGRFDAFSTSLLYSVHQKHELLRELGEAVGAEVGVPFLYRDWRPTWREGIERSKRLGLYRQSYCGCLLSEQERYAGAKGGGPKSPARTRGPVVSPEGEEA